MSGKSSRRWVYYIGALLVVLLAACGVPVFAEFVFVIVAPFLILAWHLSTGWVTFLLQRLPAVQVAGQSFVLAIVALALFISGIHAFMVSRRPGWSKRSTAAIGLALMLMFWAGTATVGITHQLVWMAQDPEPAMRLQMGLREAAHRVYSRNNLKMQGLALHADHDVRESFPPGAEFDSDGRPLHGWQTLILPMMDNAVLFRQIDRTKPWNHPENANAMRQKIHAYINSASDQFDTGDENRFALSHYSANGWVIGGDRGKSMAEIKDGLSSTLLVGEIRDRIRPWGYPINWRDPTKGLNRVPDGFGSPFPKSCSFVFADGSVRVINDQVDPYVLRRLAHPDDGEAVEIPND